MANEYDNTKDLGDFQGTEINYAEAYHDARRMMGTKGTDMDDLTYHVGLLYVNAPEKWVEPYQMLIEEIDMRAAILATL